LPSYPCTCYLLPSVHTDRRDQIRTSPIKSTFPTYIVFMSFSSKCMLVKLHAIGVAIKLYYMICPCRVRAPEPTVLIKVPMILWRMFKSIKKIHWQGERVVRKRLPITVKILKQIDPLFDATQQTHLCMRAAMWLGTCSLLRSGEFTRKPTTKYTLKLNHLTFHSKDNVIIDPTRWTLRSDCHCTCRCDWINRRQILSDEARPL